MPTLIQEIFRSRNFAVGAFYIVLQQVSVSASIYALASASLLVDEPARALPWIIAFVVLIIFPYSPGILADRKFQLWFVESVEKFFELATTHHPFRPKHFPLSDNAEDRTAIFSNSAPQIIYEFCHYVPSVLTSALNATFVLLVVSGVADVRFAITYVVSLLVCFWFVRSFGSRASRAANLTENMRVVLVSESARVWPNLTIGNTQNLAVWKSKLYSKLKDYRNAVRTEVNVLAASQQVIALISIGPTALLFILLCQQSASQPKELLLLMVVAPRIFQITLSLHDFTNMIFSWNQVKGRLEIINDFFDPISKDLEPVESTDGSIVLDFAGKSYPYYGDIEWLFSLSSGRITVTGPNGSGKTTLLLKLKELLGDSAIYMPSQSQLLFDDEEFGGSTGQHKLKDLDSVSKMDNQAIFMLLDEWDANLDKENSETASRLLDDLALTRTVIEVRHKKG